jgi:cellulose synthase/poly-beta-1,6-N-acetylglucosamine synthase-like glycosyltransferase
MIIISLLLIFFSLLLIWQFVGYPLLMLVIYRRSEPEQRDYSFQPSVSAIVPTFNEAGNIVARLENLGALNYPKEKYEVIVVDSGSTDGTANLVESYRNACPGEHGCNISLIREGSRKGKASAINLGRQHAKGEIVLVTDANALFDRAVLKEMMPHFQDAGVGAVGGRYVVSNQDNRLASSTQFYWRLECIMRCGEAILDSACTFHGEINAWRKHLMSANPEAVTEDLDMCVRLRKSGYKIQYEPRAVVYEPAPTTSKDQIKQRKRTALGTIQCLFNYLGYLAVPRNWYTLLIFPSHKVLPMISPFVLIMIFLFYLYLIPHHYLLILLHLSLSLLVFMSLFLLLTRLTSSHAQGGTSNRLAMGGVFQTTGYVLLNEYLVLLAWKDFLTGRVSVLWDKVESTRNEAC